jgi:hypothetical protein
MTQAKQRLQLRPPRFGVSEILFLRHLGLAGATYRENLVANKELVASCDHTKNVGKSYSCAESGQNSQQETAMMDLVPRSTKDLARYDHLASPQQSTE